MFTPTGARMNEITCLIEKKNMSSFCLLEVYVILFMWIPGGLKRTSLITNCFKLLCATVFSPICSAHLESLKCQPFLYCHEWFSCLLASAVDDNVCASLWTLYIEKGDAFLIFYMALVLLVNARDQLIAISHPNRFIFYYFLLMYS